MQKAFTAVPDRPVAFAPPLSTFQMSLKVLASGLAEMLICVVIAFPMILLFILCAMELVKMFSVSFRIPVHVIGFRQYVNGSLSSLVPYESGEKIDVVNIHNKSVIHKAEVIESCITVRNSGTYNWKAL